MQLNKLMEPLDPALVHAKIDELHVSPAWFRGGSAGGAGEGLPLRVLLLLTVLRAARVARAVRRAGNGRLAHGTGPALGGTGPVQPGVDADLVEQMAARVQQTQRVARGVVVQTDGARLESGAEDQEGVCGGRRGGGGGGGGRGGGRGGGGGRGRGRRAGRRGGRRVG